MSFVISGSFASENYASAARRKSTSRHTPSKYVPSPRRGSINKCASPPAAACKGSSDYSKVNDERTLENLVTTEN